MPSVTESHTMDNLEARCSDLERKILGRNPRRTDVGKSDPRTVSELLGNAQSMMDTALTGREKFAKIVKRLDELEKYLDPSFEESSRDDVDAKVEILLTSCEELSGRWKQLDDLSTLMSVLDSDEIKKVPSHKERMEQLLLLNIDAKELAADETQRVVELMQQYNALVIHFSKTFVQFDDIVTEVELSRNVPKKLDE